MKLNNRLNLLKYFSIGFFILSSLLRIGLSIYHNKDISNFYEIFISLIYGLIFDVGVLSFFWVFISIYSLFFPSKFYNSILDKVITYFFSFITFFIVIFSFFAEITFWDEFKSRFNFIAVDYLIYTYEVVNNINESYPLIYLIPSILLLTSLSFFILIKLNAFNTYFKSEKIDLKKRIIIFSISLLINLIFIKFIKNSDAEFSTNRYVSEITKSGIYSFFAALKNNEMDFNFFYSTIDTKESFQITRHQLNDKNTTFISNNTSIKRNIKNDSTTELKPNVILVLMESMSAEFMANFGNEFNLTPNLDHLAQEGIFFENLFATGNRTVRGMEAVTLSIPPTPGSSIVKRDKNQNLYTISNVFKSKGYENNFFYGGDGYFDNMNAFYGGNGFNIYDRGRGSILSDEIHTNRYNINDNEVTFENAWGICDEDIYNKVIKVSDKLNKSKKPFFNFVMTTSNHKPYTYPNKKNIWPSGTNREGAVQYADIAVGELIKKCKTKSWFKNTVFIFIADHCASSAGKDEIDVKNYHIPAIIYSPLFNAQKVNKLCSQIDIMPTLFNLLHWNYTSNFYGKDILNSNFKERAFVGTYLKLAYLNNKNQVLVLSNKKNENFYKWNKKSNDLILLPMNQKLRKEVISYYQTADYLFKNRLSK